MTNFSKKTEEFLNGNTGLMPRDLAEKVIAQFGGEESFLNNYRYVNEGHINGGIKGFIATHEMVVFFKENKDAILDFAKDTIKASGNTTAVSKMVSNLPLLNGNLSAYEVKTAIDDTEQEQHGLVASVLCMFVGEKISASYKSFLVNR